MQFGVQIFPTDRSVGPGEFARLAEERGFESVFFPEESHIPVVYEDGSPTGDELPEAYYRTLDPVVAMTAAASATTKIRIGSAVATVAQRDPLQFAKEISSLDLLSGGRVILGVGTGWNTTLMRNHGLDPRTRWRVMREKVLAMRAVWAEEQAKFHGEYVDFDPVYLWPKPVQRPGPPVLVGGNGPGVLDRVCEYGDGWMPFRSEPQPEAFESELTARIAELEQRSVDSGRARVEVTLFNADPDAAALERYCAMGLVRCVFHLPSVSADEITPMLDSLADLAVLSNQPRSSDAS